MRANRAHQRLAQAAANSAPAMATSTEGPPDSVALGPVEASRRAQGALLQDPTVAQEIDDDFQERRIVEERAVVVAAAHRHEARARVRRGEALAVRERDDLVAA